MKKEILMKLWLKFYKVTSNIHMNLSNVIQRQIRIGDYKLAAFTLAEVLITLGIIGVVAALTMPALLNDTKDQEIIAKLKKSYSIFSQATTMVQIEHPSMDWQTVEGNLDNTKTIYEYYKPFLKIAKDCGCGMTAPGCWSNDETKILNGKLNYQYAHKAGIGDTYCAARLADGTNISFDTWTGNYLGILPANKGFFFVYIDVNGDKRPNALGRDVFLFVMLNEKGIIVPAGNDNDSARCTKSDNTAYAGLDCAAKVIKEGKINY